MSYSRFGLLPFRNPSFDRASRVGIARATLPNGV
jgi:hypothetical protein